jgi:hypothetical protein
MSWDYAHRYYGALRTARADLAHSDGELVWRTEYAPIFETPERLLLALRTFWETMVNAQLDASDWDEGAVALARAHRGLVRALARAEAPAAEMISPDSSRDAAETGGTGMAEAVFAG